MRYFGQRYFRAAYFTTVGGGPEEQAAAILANRRFIANMGTLMSW